MPSARSRLVPCLAAFALLLAAAGASAQVPGESYEFQLGGMNSLWMSDSQSSLGDEEGFCADLGAGFDIVVSCHFELSVDGRGRIRGSAQFAGFTHGRYVELEGPVKGAQRGDNRSGVTKAAFQIRLLGATVEGNDLFRTRVIFKFAGRIDAAGQLSGLWTRRLCVEGAGCTITRTPSAPATWTNGHWTLSLAFEEDGVEGFFNAPTFGFHPSGIRLLSGSARVRFGDDSTCDFSLSGREDVRTAFTDLVLDPITAKCKGGSLRIRSLTRIVGRSDDTIVGELQYSLFGVRGVTVVDTTTPSVYRVLLEHYRDPINQPLPPFGVPESGSSGAVMMVTIIDWPPPQPPPVQGAGLTGSVIQHGAAAYLEMFEFPISGPPATAAESSETPAALDLSAMESSVLLQLTPFTSGPGSGLTITIGVPAGFDPNQQF